ncbi:MAG: AarF/ABC1/UbiB kinase family protein, partial [Cyanobacteria bacterium P01_H01_bin.130]
PYVARRLLMGESPQLRRRLIEVLFDDGKFQWQRLENLLRIAQGDTQFDLVPTAQMGLQYLMSDEGQIFRDRLLLALVEEDRLHTTEVQRIWDLVKDKVEPGLVVEAAWGSAWSALTEFSKEQAAQLLPEQFLPVLNNWDSTVAALRDNA